MSTDDQYTVERDGQRYGPYTWAQLQEYHDQGFVDQSDIVRSDSLTKGMPAGAFLRNSAAPDGGGPLRRLERAAAQPSRAPVALVPLVPVAQPVAQSPAFQPASKPSWFADLFTLKGRASRARFIFVTLAVWVAASVLAILGGAFLGGFVEASSGDQSAAEAAAGSFGLLLGTGAQILMAFQVVKRLHDLDRAGSHYWLLLIPFYNLYLAGVLLFKRGTVGGNRFGGDPLRHVY